MDTVIAILLATLGAGTPLVFAALGELVAEKSGVLNLGVEGMMVVGAVCGFVVAAESGSLWLGVLVAGLAGAAMAGLFAVLTLSFQANQVAAGLALTIFGLGVSAYIVLDYTSVALTGIQPLHIP
ncbi:MAG: ABC transporter permease, partial [Gammaproteobacteria bacterium]|nr:ABC transporter permease [Gammaproteobacteria bacterium]